MREVAGATAAKDGAEICGSSLTKLETMNGGCRGLLKNSPEAVRRQRNWGSESHFCQVVETHLNLAIDLTGRRTRTWARTSKSSFTFFAGSGGGGGIAVRLGLEVVLRLLGDAIESEALPPAAHKSERIF